MYNHRKKKESEMHGLYNIINKYYDSLLKDKNNLKNDVRCELCRIKLFREKLK